MTATRSAAFTTTVRVIDRVLRDAACQRLLALPACAAGLGKFWFWLSGFETAPTVPMQSLRR